MVSRRTTTVSQPQGAGIQRIDVVDLFGMYTYRIEPPSTLDQDLARLLILYGDNGSGKTTILQALFHLLSPSMRAGHRTWLGNVPFREFKVAFRDGRLVWAKRGNSLTGSYEIGAQSVEGREIQAKWVTPDERDTAELAYSQMLDHMAATGEFKYLPQEDKFGDKLDQFVGELAKIVPETLYYLGDDRRLQSDALPDDERDRGRNAREEYERLRRQASVEAKSVDPRTAALEVSIERANRWIGQQVIGASNVGGESTNAIYVDVARRIATPTETDDPGADVSVAEIEERLLYLGKRATLFTELGLMPPAPTADLIVSLRAVPPDRIRPMLSVLVPFADALEARLEALEEIRQTLATFLDQVNAYLGADKHVEYSLRRGLEIRTADERLTPSILSSGERQLLLLLTSTLYTREEPALYIIDEPELSLNMKWQRNLVSSLAACTRGSGTSFVMASHSFELMAAARERVQELRSVG